MTEPVSRSAGLWGLGLPVLAGLAGALGQAPFGLLPLAFLGIGGVVVLIARTPGPGRAFLAGWAAGSAYFALALHWIVEPFFVDPWRHGWMAPFAILLLAIGLGLFWGVSAALSRRIARGPLGLAIALAGALALAEWVRGWLFTGFPWASLGHVWTETGFLPLAAVAGTPGLTLALILLAGLPAALAPRRPWLGPILSLGLGAALLWAGTLYPQTVEPLDNRPTVRLIQPNAPQHQKWDPAHVMTFYHRQLSMTAEPGDPALTLWPETAIPWSGESAGAAFRQIAEASGGTPVVLGLLRRLPDGVRNGLVLIDGAGEVQETYDKYHLVPFGEYIPFAPIAARFGLRGLADTIGGGFTPGPGPQILDLPGLGAALPLICYEAIFPRNIRAAPRRPDVLLHATNDAWFGQTAGPQQHLAQARLRAAEFGIPVIRAANTGISAVIDGHGRVLDAIPLGRSGHLDLPVPAALPPTIYARTGDGPALFVALLLLLTPRLRPARKAD